LPGAAKNVSEAGATWNPDPVPPPPVATFSVTAIDCGELTAPLEVTVTVPVYAPAASPAGDTLTFTTPGVEVAPATAWSQLPPSVVETLVVNDVATLLLVLTFTTWLGGEAPP